MTRFAELSQGETNINNIQITEAAAGKKADCLVCTLWNRPICNLYI